MSQGQAPCQTHVCTRSHVPSLSWSNHSSRPLQFVIGISLYPLIAQQRLSANAFNCLQQQEDNRHGRQEAMCKRVASCSLDYLQFQLSRFGERHIIWIPVGARLVISLSFSSSNHIRNPNTAEWCLSYNSLRPMVRWWERKRNYYWIWPSYSLSLTWTEECRRWEDRVLIHYNLVIFPTLVCTHNKGLV